LSYKKYFINNSISESIVKIEFFGEILLKKIRIIDLLFYYSGKKNSFSNHFQF